VRAFLTLFALLSLVATAAAQSPAPSPAPSPVHAHRSVSTTNAEAQTAFDEGLTLLYAFNPEEGRRFFEHAVRTDPALAIGWWGVAMSYGVNINTGFDAGAQQHGHEAIVKAQTLESGASAAERSLIEAAATRFKYLGANDGDRSARAYRDAMNAVAGSYPADDDVQVLAAEAEMDVHPWTYFNRDGTPVADTLDIIARLQTVLARAPHHLGANHYIIHALEESPNPERALPAADYLASIPLEPAAEHLIHMPAHAFMRTGRYHDAGMANLHAIEAYHKYLANDPAGHADYFGHDCVFGVDAFLMSDENARAHEMAALCARQGATMSSLIDLRFHRWDALTADDSLGSFALGMLALDQGHIPAAKTQLKTLRIGADAVSTIETALLTAAIARADNRSDEEIAALQRGVTSQDGGWYSEPPRFFYPVRESLGAAFYRAARYADAEQAFRADLERNPDNPRSLYGLTQTLLREGRDDDAQATQKRFENASHQADVPFDMKDL
jgi:tetratricopeptide (TPR) repeat protein